MQKPKITVVGSNMVDLISYIERMPQTGETITAPDFSLGYGGKGANQAVAASLLGGDVRMVTKVGDDLFGPNTIKNLESFGINTEFSEIVPGVSSGVAPIFVNPDSHNSILIIKGANSHLLPEDIDRAGDLILDSDMVIMQLEVNLETIYHTVALCEKNNIPVILNPAPADPALDAEKVKSVAFFVPNETELQTLTKMNTDSIDQVKEAAGSLRDRGFQNIIVTLGEKGSLFFSKDKTEIIPAIKVQSIDTTGAGDAFIGCFAVYYCETGDVLKAMSLANRYAALSTTCQGTQKSFASRRELEDLI
ncbi:MULTISPECIES: ribokinase [unclassified Oceanispirochaeta]|uniref:ribokinase n=1 Tax=unclassified Oceanispirochaeta TaxID=2635722 RepID=UPI000E0952E7|nr:MULTISPECIES: ribokinase [unclassified Oceanispirochaeta]MBF9018187.1 ribokinase [Oceanispirochaeta sp. M2]NPD74630.1 ribokinase [Oceanispirochaeta sp. M1]RDG29500.1 ribokinase [Oceanispirochaeta sp. M1]